MKPTRRALLALLCFAAPGLASCGFFSVHRPHPEYRRLARRLAGLPKDREALRGIGLAYLRTLKHRPTATQVAEAWFPEARERKRVLALSGPRLLGEVTDRIFQDYQMGRLVSVNGWLLSETEGRFAALVALMRRG